MTDPIYHLETEIKNGKHYLTIRLPKGTLLSHAKTASEKSALELLIKEQFQVAPERAFFLLKLLGTTGRVYYQNKKVVIDPFTSFDFYLEAERLTPDSACVTGIWKLGNQSGTLHTCDWIVPADPSWILKEGIIRSIDESISHRWIRLGLAGPQHLTGQALSQFLSDTHEEVPVVWNGSPTIDPLPFLTLSCRHGGFADLWFDYGSFGKIAAHDSTASPWRNLTSEKNWEKDLLETDFIKKIIERSHYYCPLDKVAKSLTFLLEIGWTIFDVQGRKVVRQKKTELDAHFLEEKIIVRAKVHYEEHQADLKDLVGAFNRHETFVE